MIDGIARREHGFPPCQELLIYYSEFAYSLWLEGHISPIPPECDYGSPAFEMEHEPPDFTMESEPPDFEMEHEPAPVPSPEPDFDLIFEH